MLFGGAVISDALEVRRKSDGSFRVSGRFPYQKTTTLSDGGRNGGRPRKEKFAPLAFSFRVEKPDEEIYLLSGHDWNRPLASKLTGGLQLKDARDALTFTATISPEVAETSHGRDAIALLSSGLSVGLSPGFRVPPPRAVPDAEEIEQEPDDGTLDENGDPRRGALIRNVKAALLYELSIVTRQQYAEASVEARSWEPRKTGDLAASNEGLERLVAGMAAMQRWR